MNIGIDIDDTITKTSEEADICAKEYTENVLKRNFEISNDIVTDSMWAKQLYNWTQEENDNFWKIYYNKIIQNVKPKENVVDVINKLSENNKIIIITARWKDKERIVEQITHNWLKAYNIKYNKLLLGHRDKRNAVKENEIDIFIDDNYEICKQISQLGIKTFIMNSRLNNGIEDKNLERVFSWNDIIQKINNEEEA